MTFFMSYYLGIIFSWMTKYVSPRANVVCNFHELLLWELAMKGPVLVLLTVANFVVETSDTFSEESTG